MSTSKKAKECVALREVVACRDRGRCRVCNTKKSLQYHHLKFRSQGGEDTVENLLLLCFKCHEEVHKRRLFPTPNEEQTINANKPIHWTFNL